MNKKNSIFTVIILFLATMNAAPGDPGYTIDVLLQDETEEVVEGEWVTTVIKEGWVIVGRDTTSDPEGFSEDYLRRLEADGYEYVYYYSAGLFHITWGYYAEEEEITEWVVYDPPRVITHPAEWDSVFIPEGTPPEDISALIEDEEGPGGFPDPEYLEEELGEITDQADLLYKDYLDQCEYLDETVNSAQSELEKRREEFKSPVAGDPVRVSTGELSFSETDEFGSWAENPKVIRHYGSMTKAGLSFGKAWAFNHDKRIIFGYNPKSGEKRFLSETVFQNIQDKKDEAFSHYAGMFSEIDGSIESYENIMELLQDTIGNLISVKEQQDHPKVISRLEEEIELLNSYRAIVDDWLSMAVDIREELSDTTGQLANLDNIKEELLLMEEEFALEEQYGKAAEQLNRYSLSENSDFSAAHTGIGTVIYIDERGMPVTYFMEDITLSETPAGEGISRFFSDTPVLLDTDNRETGHIKNDGSITLLKKRTASETFDSFGRIIRSRDTTGSLIDYSYGQDGRLQNLTDQHGREISISRNNLGLISKVSRGESSYSYTYDSEGRLRSVTDPEGVTVSFAYQENYLISISRENNSEIRYKYDDHFPRRVIEVIDEAGFSEYFSYYTAAGSTVFRDKSGNEAAYWFDDSGNEILRRYQDGVEETRRYDANGNLIRFTDGCGNLFTFRYDAFGNRTFVIFPDGSRIFRQYDEEDRIIFYTDRRGNRTEFCYGETAVPEIIITPFGSRTYTIDSLRRVTSFTDEENRSTYYEYNSAGFPVKVVYPQGGSEEFSWDEYGRCTAHTNSYGGTFRYSYDKLGRLIKSEDPMGYEERWEYGIRGDVTSYTGKEGQIVQYAYDGRHNLSIAEYPDGAKNEYRYDGRGKLIWKREWEKVTEYEYDCRGNCISCRCPDTGENKYYRYDGCGRVTEITYADTSSVKFTYDALGRIIRKSGPMGEITAWRYRNGNCIEYQKPMGSGITFQYDDYGNCTHRIFPSGGIEQFRYDQFGRMTAKIDQAGYETVYHHQGSNITGIDFPDGGSRRFVYDAGGNLSRYESESGNIITYQYDTMGRLVNRYDEVLGRTSYRYTPQGRLKKVIKNDGSVVSFSYNIYGQVTSFTDEDGYSWRYRYDEKKNLVEEIDPLGNLWTRSYDQADRIVSITDPSDFRTHLSYDEKGNLLTVKDGSGMGVSYEYDAGNRITSLTGPGGNTRIFTYDLEGNYTNVTLPSGKKYVFQYDEMGRVIRESSVRDVEYRYDIRGNLSEVQFPDGRVLSYQYDPMNRLVSVYENNGESESFEYDAAGNLIEARKDGIVYCFSFDKAGRVTSFADEGAEAFYEFTYDSAGNRSGIESSGGRTITYTYDKRKKLTGASDSQGTVSYSYDAAGREVLRQYGDHIFVKRVYQDAQLKGISCFIKNGRKEEIIFGEGYLYDNSGRRKAIISYTGEVTGFLYRNGKLESAYYPAIPELVERTKSELTEHGIIPHDFPSVDYFPSEIVTREEIHTVFRSMDFQWPKESIRLNRCWREQYFYDEDGNRIVKSTPLGDIHYAYDDKARLIKAGSVIIEYANGCVSRAGSTQYRYDLQDRIIGAESGTDKKTYQYDPLGNLLGGHISKQSVSSGFRFIIDPVSALPLDIVLQKESSIADSEYGKKEKQHVPYRYRYPAVEQEQSSGKNRFALPGKDGVLHISNMQAEPVYQLVDGTGTVRARGNYNGSSFEQLVYDAFGLPVYPENKDSSEPYPAYGGSIFIPSLSVYNMGHRTYLPKTGRFLSPDPAKEGINWYVYAGGDPVNFIDPLGLTILGIEKAVKQQDERWRNLRLGTEDTTIGSEGCKLTGITNITNAILGDLSETPASLNNIALREGLFCGGGGAISTRGASLIIEAAAGNYTIGVERIETKAESIYESLCELDEDTSIDVFVQAKISTCSLNDSSNIYTHWVNIVDIDDSGKVIVVDTSIRNRLTIDTDDLLAVEVFTAKKIK